MNYIHTFNLLTKTYNHKLKTQPEVPYLVLPLLHRLYVWVIRLPAMLVLNTV